MLIIIIFGFIGLIIGSFTLLSVLICLFFAIPLTKKLERGNMLIGNHPVVKNYLKSILLLSAIFLLSLWLIYYFGSAYAFKGYLGGIIFSIIFGIGKIGKNKNNLSDYLETQARYLAKPIEEVIGFLQ